jgi:hypothetical protein
MTEGELTMLQQQWDENVNQPRTWNVEFSVKNGEDVSTHEVQVQGKSFADVSNRFIMESFQITRFKVLERLEDGYVLAQTTFRVGPDFSQTVTVRCVDQYSALHILTTEVVKVEQVLDPSLDEHV